MDHIFSTSPLILGENPSLSEIQYLESLDQAEREAWDVELERLRIDNACAAIVRQIA